jgi:glycosyltransferase involved in cell wall biosynthesis
MARVSVIIPTHNRATLLPRAINSAKEGGEDVEVVVVDDASTDETPSVCRAIPGITYIRLDRNRGPANARNVGISTSTGEFIAFLDDDDIRLAGSIDRQMEILAANDHLGFVYAQVLFGDPVQCVPTGEIRPLNCPTGDLFWLILGGNYIYMPTVIARKQALEAVGLFDPTLRHVEDWETWIRLAEKYEVGALNEPVAIYREASRAVGSASSNLPRISTSSVRTLAKAARLPRALEAGREALKQMQADQRDSLWYGLIREGNAAFVQRDFSYGMSNYITAAWLYPGKAPRSVVRVMARFLRNVVRPGGRTI